MRFLKIPKTAFFYWGGSPMSYLNYLTLISFRHYHPDWKMVLYVPKVDSGSKVTWSTGEQAAIYTGKDYREEAKAVVDEVVGFDFTNIGFSNDMHDVHKADVMRQFLMAEKGGLWCDMDVLWVKSITKMDCPDNVGVMLVWNPNTRKTYYSTGIVMAKPFTYYHSKILKHCKDNYKADKYQCVGPELLRKLFPTEQHVRESECGSVIYNAPYETFYPFHYKKLEEFFELTRFAILSKNTVAIHWFGGAAISRTHMNRLCPETISGYSGTVVGEVIKKLMENINDR